MIPFKLSIPNSSKSGDAQGGQIGGTAFNIGGINLGTQYPTSVDAQGSSPAPFASMGGHSAWYLLAGIAGLGVLLFVMRR